MPPVLDVVVDGLRGPAGDGFDFEEFFEAIGAAFAPVSGLFVAAKGRAFGKAFPVGFDHAGSQATCDVDAFFIVWCLDVVGEAVVCVVGDCDCFIDGVKFQDRQNGAKNLFAGDGHVVRDICDHRWFDEIATVQTIGPAQSACGEAAFGDADFDEALNFIELGFGDDGADVFAFVGGGTDVGVAGHLGGDFDGVVVEAAFDQHAGWGVAGLACVAEAMCGAAFDGIGACVGEDDIRAFAAQFEADTFEGVCCGFGDEFACAGGAREGDHVDVFVGGEL